jgi:hypothetical protein
VLFVTQNRFTAPKDEETLEELRNMLGDEADSVIQEVPKVTLKPEVFENEKLQEKLVELMGDCFDEFFSTEVTVKLYATNLGERLYKIAADQDELDDIRSLMPQAKPALKG